MGAETKYPQYTLPRALKVSVFLVFAVNALFQWFLVGLVPHEFYHILAVADAPYAEGLRAAGLVGFPIILLCIGIAFGGDLSTINPGIAAPARYIYTMAEDGSLPKFLCKVHPKYKTCLLYTSKRRICSAMGTSESFWRRRSGRTKRFAGRQ